MKIAGQKPNFYRSQTIDFPTDSGEIITLTLTPPPLDFYERLEKVIPSPVPPRTFAKDEKGKLQKDENGRAIVIRDEDDKRYRDALKDAQQLQSTALVHEVIKHDKTIEFDTKEPTTMTIEFYRAIRQELSELLPLPIFLKLVETAGKMLSISEEALREAEKSFS